MTTTSSKTTTTVTTTSRISSSTSVAPTAQVARWIFPPESTETSTVDITADFGPVHYNDVVVLEWTPEGASPRVAVECTSVQGLSYYYPFGGYTSPLAYYNDISPNNKTASDEVHCRFTFPNTTEPSFRNSATWQFIWDERAIPSAYALPVSTTTSSGSQGSGTSSTSGGPTMTVTAQVDTSSVPLNIAGDLSTKAAIGVGVVLGVLLLALLVLGACFLAKRRKHEHTTSHQGVQPAQQHDHSAALAPPVAAPFTGSRRNSGSEQSYKHSSVSHSTMQMSQTSGPTSPGPINGRSKGRSSLVQISNT